MSLRLELAEGGTLLDVLLRAEKRGLVTSVDEFLMIREIRNEISHEYANEGMKSLFDAVLTHCPILIRTVERSLKYAVDRHLSTRSDGEIAKSEEPANRRE